MPCCKFGTRLGQVYRILFSIDKESMKGIFDIGRGID